LEESDNMEIGVPVRLNEEEFKKSLAPPLTQEEKDAYVNMTDEQKEKDLRSAGLWEYFKELKNNSGDEEIDFHKDEDVDMEDGYFKWNESHKDRDVWRDRGGNWELKRRIEDGNNSILSFIEDLNKELKSQGFKPFEDVIPMDKTENKPNKAYYTQLQTWANSVLVFVKGLDEPSFNKYIEYLDAHVHNVTTMVNIEAEEKDTYRPIRRYSINSEERNVNLALNVVHTSPSDEGKTTDGKKRMKVFSQISTALEDMSKRKNPNEVMIGDLYINPKDHVESNKKAETVFEEKGVKIAGDTTAATNRWSNKKDKVKYNQADIILVNKDTNVVSGGIVKRGEGGLEPVDTDHTETDKWTTDQGKQKAFSDHAPVGAIIDLSKGIGVHLPKIATEEMLENAEREKVEMPWNPFFSILKNPRKEEK